jgi:hypothetical protein
MFCADDDDDKPLVRDGFVAQEGEIRQEFDSILKKHAEDLENEKRKEAEASSELIRQLQVTLTDKGKKHYLAHKTK